MSTKRIYALSLGLGVLTSLGLMLSRSASDPAGELRAHLRADNGREIVVLIDPADCALTGQQWRTIRTRLDGADAETHGVFLRVPEGPGERTAITESFRLPIPISFDDDGFWLELYSEMGMRGGAVLIWERNRFGGVVPLEWLVNEGADAARTIGL